MAKTLLIDWYNTLCNSPYFICEDKELEKFLHKKLFIEERENVEQWLTGKITDSQIVQILSDLQITVQTIREAMNHGVENAKIYNYENLKILTDLRFNGYQVVLSTNIMPSFAELIKKFDLNKYFDAILTSYELGCLKTDVKNSEMVFFSNFMRQNELSFSDLIIIDDDKKLLDLFEQNGAQTFWVFSIKETNIILKKILRGAI